MKLLIPFILMPAILLSMPNDPKDKNNPDADQGQKPLFSFGVIADIQYSDYEPAGTRFYRLSLNKLREAVTSFREDSVDFVITLGDMIDKDYNSYKPVLNIIDSSGLKFYHVTGNHDYSVDSRFKRRLSDIYGSKTGYYSVLHKKFRFIFINGNEISTYASNNKTIIKQANDLIDTLKKSGAPNAVEWNGGISTRQLGWLENQMNESILNNEDVFLLCHFPVVPENAHNLLNYKQVLAVLEKYHNLVAWINGHNHSGNYGNFNMTHFVTIKGMVETETRNSFARIEVYKNKIWIVGSGREKSQILAY